MFSLEVHQLIFEEQHKDFRRDVAHHQLVKIALRQQSNNRNPIQKTVGWFGYKMVKWGSKLQQYSQSQHLTVTHHRS